MLHLFANLLINTFLIVHGCCVNVTSGNFCMTDQVPVPQCQSSRGRSAFNLSSIHLCTKKLWGFFSRHPPPPPVTFDPSVPHRQQTVLGQRDLHHPGVENESWGRLVEGVDRHHLHPKTIYQEISTSTQQWVIKLTYRP